VFSPCSLWLKVIQAIQKFSKFAKSVNQNQDETMGGKTKRLT
jgi:hypothetical protein